MASRVERVKLIQAIEQHRKSRVITYLCSDRAGISSQMGQDAVRPMYDHLLEIGPTERIDLYLYGPGGVLDVPWRIVSMIREYAREFNVIIPYRAMSAATLVAFGADHIIMGPKAELGPVDPGISLTVVNNGQQLQQEIRVEDVMSYVAFLKERGGLGDQRALTRNIHLLAEQLSPWVLGQFYRTHSHIRVLARKLLTNHQTRLDEQRIGLIVETLAEKTYSHGHSIGRKEAKELGLPVEEPLSELDADIWQLMLHYEELMQLRTIFDPSAIVTHSDSVGEVVEPVVFAVIETTEKLSMMRGQVHVKLLRQPPPQFQINVNVALSLPPELSGTELKDDQEMTMQSALQQFANQVQQAVPGLVEEQVRKQMQIVGVVPTIADAQWRDYSSAPD